MNELDTTTKIIKDYFNDRLKLNSKIADLQRENVLLTNDLARTQEKLKGSETRFKKFTKENK